jgi:cysteine desulfurase/selenocysteine lyase
VPWQQLQKIYGFAIVYIPLQDDGYSIDREKLSIILKDRDVAVLSVGHVSNVIGTIYDIKRIHSLVPDAFFLVDGSQSVPHFSVDIQKFGCDALIFTAHKLYAYT